MIQGLREMPNVPKKLKRDAIVEALLEIQFEHSEVAEVVVGRLAGLKLWAGYQNIRLPIADVPAGIRDADVNLRYQAIFQLNRPTPGEIVKIGPRVLSLHVLSPYPGWAVFSPQLKALIEALYEAVSAPIINRITLRYINALSPSHGLKSLWDLDFEFLVAKERPATELTTAYIFEVSPHARAQVTLASPGFVTGNLPPDAAAYVDVNVFTPAPMGVVSPEYLTDWVELAHDAEKVAFFSLWPEHILQPLRED